MTNEQKAHDLAVAITAADYAIKGQEADNIDLEMVLSHYLDLYADFLSKLT